MRYFVFFWVGIAMWQSGVSQSFASDNYYLFPINPGQQNYLAGTMGELRSSHFHAGLDIKTGGQTGLSVRATADGYISRIKVDVGGYGHALYMTHPNGTTSVYAHLDEFAEPVAGYVLQEQYRQESFAVDLFPAANQFVYRQGEIIAKSGNTGSSSGPHLHFEIRDSQQRILDPLKFNFNEIKDDIAPVLKNVAFVTLDGQARVNDTYGRFEFDVLKTQNTFHTRVPIELRGLVGMEIYGYDLLNGVYNRNGIPEITLLVDGDTVFYQRSTSLSFDQQRSILVHMDYATMRQKGVRYNKLFVDDGNTNDIYPVPSRGFHFTDQPHVIRVLLRDSYGNISVFETTVNDRKVVNKPNPRLPEPEIYRNYLHWEDYISNNTGEPTIAWVGHRFFTVHPYREDRQLAYFLWDLRKGIPDSLVTSGKTLLPGIFSRIPSGEANQFLHRDVELAFRQSTLFDTLYLQFEKKTLADGRELFAFPHSDVPLRSEVRVTLRPRKTYSPDSRVFTWSNGRLAYVGGTWDGGTISFSTRDLGTYTISRDSIAPYVTPSIINTREVYFKISDDLSGIKNFRATLNGEFVLMKYEFKKNLIWSVKKDPNIPFQGEFKLVVEDQCGNITEYTKTF